MTTRCFTMEDQVAFARLSGDFNPVHVDDLAARRLMFGGPIVHGMHLLLWVLQHWSADHPGQHPIEIRASFTRPVRVGGQASLDFAPDKDGKSRATVRTDGVKAASFQIDWAEAAEGPGTCLPGVPPRADPDVLSADDLQAEPSGDLNLHWPHTEAGAVVPGLADRVPAIWLSAIATASRLVGVACPGLNSVFGELTLARAEDVSTPALHWQVKAWDARFSYADIALTGPGMTGRVGAFLRPPSRSQPGLAALSAHMEAGALAGQKALVVGGSRGLGEVTAKLLVAGGAEVTLSYARGAEDATRVAEEITAAGGKAQAMQIDVTAPTSEALRALAPSHVYFFATPFAFAGAKGVFSPDLFARFARVYVDGFMSVFEAVNGPGLKGVFYPSSVAIDEQAPDMGEYIAAKIAGEAMCRHLARAHPKVAFSTPRLPRLDTDQTQSLSAVDNTTPGPFIAGLIREFAGQGG